MLKFTSQDETISSVLGGDRVYKIPNFQRNFSWKHKNYDDFINDLIKSAGVCIDSDSKELKLQSEANYFYGTILVVGDKNKVSLETPYDVVDGQQRLTTMTLFFAAIREIITRMKPSYKHEFDKPLMFERTNKGKAETISRIYNQKLHPILPVNILRIGVHEKHTTDSESQEWLEKSHEYFLTILEKENLLNRIKKINADITLKTLEDDNYIEILEEIGKQVLKATVVTIYSEDLASANVIYRNFNSRGLRLSETDLIKNEIFAALDDSSDSTYTSWSNIEKRLYGIEDMDTYFFHYMYSKFSGVTSKNLFDFFSGNIKQDIKSLSEFLADIEKYSNYYRVVVRPSENEKLFGIENYFLQDNNSEIRIQLNCLSDLKATQVRIVILGLIFARENDFVTNSQFRELLNIIVHHQVLNTIAGTSANKFTATYSRTSRQLRSGMSFDKVKNELLKALHDKFPVEDAVTSIENIKYNNKNRVAKMSALEKKNRIIIKHVLQTLAIKEQKRLGKQGNKAYKYIYDATLEHIIDQNNASNYPHIYSLGNILLLEASEHTNSTDKKSMYAKSKIKMTTDFISELEQFNSDAQILKRNKLLLKQYYDFVKNLK